MGILRPGDRISPRCEDLLAEAGARALALSRDYQPPASATIELRHPREAWLAQWIDTHCAGYERVICAALSGIMAAGEVTEAELSRRELAAFMRLAAREETLARIEHLLDTGKPLRN